MTSSGIVLFVICFPEDLLTCSALNFYIHMGQPFEVTSAVTPKRLFDTELTVMQIGAERILNSVPFELSVSVICLN